MTVPRRLAVLAALERATKRLESEDRPMEFMLIRLPGGRTGLKPELLSADDPPPLHLDILDFEEAGYLRRLPSASSSVLDKFALTLKGRGLGSASELVPSIPVDTDRAQRTTPTPSLDDVLEWLSGLEQTASGASVLANGQVLVEAVLAAFGDELFRPVVRRIFDLRDEGLFSFTDPAGFLEQVDLIQRLHMSGNFRLTAAGHDRLSRSEVAAGTQVTQIVNAVHAQVAGADITNVVSFVQLLDRLEDEIDGLQDVDADAKAEAKDLVAKLRTAAGNVATGTASSAGGAVLGGLLKELLGLK